MRLYLDDRNIRKVKVAIKRAANAGVSTVMITGDYLATARAIAENIGLLPKGGLIV